MSSMRPRSPAHARPATTRGKNLCLGERREGEDEEGERSSSWLESVGVAEGEEDDEDEGDVEEGLEEDEAGERSFDSGTGLEDTAEAKEGATEEGVALLVAAGEALATLVALGVFAEPLEPTLLPAEAAVGEGLAAAAAASTDAGIAFPAVPGPIVLDCGPSLSPLVPATLLPAVVGEKASGDSVSLCLFSIIIPLFLGNG